MTDYLESLNKKDIKAWEAFYGDYYASLCSYVHRFVRDAAGTEDIVQETLIKIWHSDRVFPTMKELTAYLYKAVYVNSLDYIKTKKLHHSHLQLFFQQEQDDGDDELFALTLREELIRRLRLVVNELPEERRKILQLTLNGLSGKEIAENLGITVYTVKAQKNQAFKYLRDKLEGAFFLFFVCRPFANEEYLKKKSENE